MRTAHELHLEHLCRPELVSNASEIRAKVVAKAARKKVQWHYVKIKTQKAELKMKE